MAELIFPHLVSQHVDQRPIVAGVLDMYDRRQRSKQSLADGAARHVGARHKQSCLGYSIGCIAPGADTCARLPVEFAAIEAGAGLVWMNEGLRWRSG